MYLWEREAASAVVESTQVTITAPGRACRSSTSLSFTAGQQTLLQILP